MKKYSLLAFVLLVCGLSFAQDEAVVLKATGASKISKQLTPQQVIDSLNKTFPNAKAVEYYKMPPGGAKNGWTITEEDNLDPNETIEYYTIKFKRENMKYYALYTADGKLVMSKLEESSVALPEPVKASLMTLKDQYPGYKVTSKTYYKNLNYSKKEEYYEVVAEKGKEKKRIFYKADGTIIKMKG